MKAILIILIVILDLLFVLFASALTLVSLPEIMFYYYSGYGHYIPIELFIWYSAMVIVPIIYLTIGSVCSVLHCKGNVGFHVGKIMLASFYIVHLLLFIVCAILEEKYFYYMRIDEYGLLKMLFFIAVPAINYFLLKLMVEKPALVYRDSSSMGR